MWFVVNAARLVVLSLPSAGSMNDSTYKPSLAILAI